MTSLPENLRKNATDAGYIAVGLGVMGAEQAKHAGDTVASRIGEAAKRVRATAATTRDRADDLFGDVRVRVTQVVDDGRTRVRSVVNRAA